jgi:formylglycine-generating enzyme required for sulfatase activity
MGVYLVTQRQWRAVMRGDPSRSIPSNTGDDYPVDGISWNVARSFCAEASRQTGRTIRLPTEAEWEYACRAGTTTRFHFGDEITPQLANYETHEGGRHGSSEVGSYPPNAFGLYDVHGNLYEWVSDRYDRGYYRVSPAVDPRGPDGGEDDHRLLRGGSWYYGVGSCRSAHRIECSVDYGHNDQGFRVACER